jgi:predicted ArsR family transcriptional regulator
VDRDHELSAVLADDTRYHIYRAIAEQPGADVTVADIADRFHLHPNVARMHLSKLEQAGFLATHLRKTSGGGRPARLYRLSDKVVTFGFPPRRYELLARLALSALSVNGAVAKADQAARAAGIAEGRRVITGESRSPRTPDDVVTLVRRVAEDQGLLPELAWRDVALHITVHNCAFRELSGADPDLVCGMHRSFLQGVVEVVMTAFGSVTFSVAEKSISCGADCCELVCTPERTVATVAPTA